eukprot:SAG22_NODE_5560_length_993_cov_0.736018_1_plen_225_part_01
MSTTPRLPPIKMPGAGKLGSGPITPRPPHGIGAVDAIGGEAFEVLMISDWGCRPGGESCDSDGAQQAVAKAMSDYVAAAAAAASGTAAAAVPATAAAKHRSTDSFSFILNMGDSFYDNGLHDRHDVAVAATTHQSVYGDLPGLSVPWKTVLGNHDYRGNMSLVIGRHIGALDLPAAYYDWYEDIGGGEHVHFIALDTNAVQSAIICKTDQQHGANRCRRRMKEAW